ncbi:MAG: bifunctional folylpolyglutamate synthase/dihydrofolate synthase [Armatimonadota bacterium]
MTRDGSPLRARGLDTYDEAVAYLDGLVDYERRLGFDYDASRFSLERPAAVLELLGRPQEQFRSLHIAGTKGKGSTAAMAASILRAAGHSVGLYTSPHLCDFRERIAVNGKPICREAVAALVPRVRPAIERVDEDGSHGKVTYFEALTALAFLHFAESHVDYVVAEVGLGGRLDATNVLSPAACAITTVSHDHTDVLGEELEAVAAEKAAIIKEGARVIVGPQRGEAWPPILSEVRAKRGSLAAVDLVGGGTRPLPSDVEAAIIRAEAGPVSLNGQRFAIAAPDVSVEGLLPLLGAHQVANAAVAVGLLGEEGAAVPGLTAGEVAQGLANVHWPGRFQVIQREPLVVLDAAHNGDSAQALRRTWEDIGRPQPTILVLGVLADKNLRAIAEELRELATDVVLCSPDTPRALPAADMKERLADLWPAAITADSAAEGIERGLALASADGGVLITGSVYLVGEALRHFGLWPCEEQA